jgi:hypothetical protein
VFFETLEIAVLLHELSNGFVPESLAFTVLSIKLCFELYNEMFWETVKVVGQSS